LSGKSGGNGQEEKVFDAAKMMHAAGWYAELSGGNAGDYRSIFVALAAEVENRAETIFQGGTAENRSALSGFPLICGDLDHPERGVRFVYQPNITDIE
jgi:hypothetical protein